MIKFKQGFNLLLTITLLLANTARAADYEYFPDVSSNAAYAEAVNALADLGIFSGDENGNFNPKKTLTRAEFATVIVKLFEEEDRAEKITKSSFNDVPSTHWACGYITVAVELGMVNGYGNGKFGPSDTLTYEQAVTIIVHMEGVEDAAVKSGGYPDGYIKIANDLGITKGTTASDSVITRSEVAILIYNYLMLDENFVVEE